MSDRGHLPPTHNVGAFSQNSCSRTWTFPIQMRQPIAHYASSSSLNQKVKLVAKELIIHLAALLGCDRTAGICWRSLSHLGTQLLLRGNKGCQLLCFKSQPYLVKPCDCPKVCSMLSERGSVTVETAPLVLVLKLFQIFPKTSKVTLGIKQLGDQDLPS